MNDGRSGGSIDELGKALDNLVNTAAGSASKLVDTVAGNIATGINTASEKINNAVNAKPVRPVTPTTTPKETVKPKAPAQAKPEPKSPVKYTRKKSVLPIYLAALSWLLWSISGTFYSLKSLIGATLISVAVYLIGSKIFKGKKIPVQEPEKIERFSESGNVALDGLLKEGQLGLQELGRLRRSIRNEEVCTKVQQIEEVTQKILQNAKDDTRDIAKSRKFLNYYLPTTISLLNSYDRMADVGGVNAGNTVKRIEDLLDDLIVAYNRHYDSLFSDEALDVETDIRVLEATLKQEGLL